MTFAEFHKQAWNDHAGKTREVAERIASALGLIVKDEEAVQMASLVAHVFGEHLGAWSEGVALLERLREVPAVAADGEGERAIARAVASLRMAGGEASAAQGLSSSDRIRILAVAASALSEQKQTARARLMFEEAAALARTGLAKEDPANRALAITGNNLACTMEEKPDRTPEETALMIQAAQTGREYWAIAGTWLHTERAEYRLANTYLQAGNPAEALKHAQLCLDIVAANNAEPLEWFFGYEALALAEKAAGNSASFASALAHVKQQFEKLSAGDKAWCESTLRKLS